MEPAVLTDLAPTIPRSAYTTWAPSAADRLDWHRRITALNAAAARHAVTRDTAQRVLLGLMDTAEWATRIWALDDLFDTADRTLRLLAQPEPATATLTADTTTFGAPLASIQAAVRRMRNRPFQQAAPPAPRPLGTAWTRFVHAHPERPGLYRRNA